MKTKRLLTGSNWCEYDCGPHCHSYISDITEGKCYLRSASKQLKFTHTIKCKRAVNTDLTEVILQLNSCRSRCFGESCLQTGQSARELWERTRGWQRGSGDRSHLAAYEGLHSPPFTQYSCKRERDSPQRKQAPFKEKTIGPPQQIPANLPGPERRGEERRWVSRVMDACQSPC